MTPENLPASAAPAPPEHATEQRTPKASDGLEMGQDALACLNSPRERQIAPSLNPGEPSRGHSVENERLELEMAQRAEELWRNGTLDEIAGALSEEQDKLLRSLQTAGKTLKQLP